MTRRYAEPIDVRVDAAHDRGAPYTVRPEQFLWRGRLYVVRAVLAQWVEVGAWWSQLAGVGPAARSAPRSGGSGGGERAVWRVEAASGARASAGVYDLVHDHDSGRWSLARTLD